MSEIIPQVDQPKVQTLLQESHSKIVSYITTIEQAAKTKTDTLILVLVTPHGSKLKETNDEINAANSLLQLSKLTSITDSTVKKKKNTDDLFHSQVRGMSKEVKEQLKTDIVLPISNTKNLIIS